MDCYPIVNKAFYLVVQVEKQKKIIKRSNELIIVDFQTSKFDTRKGSFKKKKWKNSIGSILFFKYCKKENIIGSCFQIIEFPNWFIIKCVSKNKKIITTYYGRNKNESQANNPLKRSIKQKNMLE